MFRNTIELLNFARKNGGNLYYKGYEPYSCLYII